MLRCAGLDNAIRWQLGERLEQLFEARCELTPEAVAVDARGLTLTYRELNDRANRLARYLLERGAGPGRRIGLLFDDPIDGYAAMLAVHKTRAAYVPLEPTFPAQRLAYIAADAGITLILSRAHLAGAVGKLDPAIQVLALDGDGPAIEDQSAAPLTDEESGWPVDDLAYVIYTSGTTGAPKGVAVGHPAICNFVRVAAEVYGVLPQDRVYQGLTTAFDFSIEEIWVAWMVGATLVPKPSGPALLGSELSAFLREQQVTALCCVPTLLATLENDLPQLRFLLVSGESCPQDLVGRWHRAGRRFLNVYGPTEATVSATWSLLEPGRPVTIGVPLPTYSIVVLDPQEDRALPLGHEGEIAIAGVGLAEGYLGLPERTAQSFIPDFLALPDNPSGRIYRTGDLGRVSEQGEIEHLGRIDTQVKIRGYRIELAEIEAVLRDVPEVGAAVVQPCETTCGQVELVGYCTRRGGQPIDPERTLTELRRRLAPYMVPAYLEELEVIPMMASGKVDRRALPPPSGRRLATLVGEHVAARDGLESVLADSLAKLLGVEEISVESHFFDELGVSSLLIAQFTADLRRRGSDLPAVSIRDIYTHPTIRALAAALTEAEPSAHPTAFADPEQPEPIGTPHYVLCGVLQLLALVTYVSLAAFGLDVATNWLDGAHGFLAIYLRSLGIGGAMIAGTGLVPVVAKWVLIGRWKPRRIRVWSLPYVRFWTVKTLVRSNPAARLFRGTFLFRLYLRALGAQIEPGALIVTQHMPICTDLVSIGAGAVIRNNTWLNGYRARDGVIEIGPVTVGRDAYVGEQCALEIYSRIEDGATVGHTTAVHAGQVIPAGEVWHGSPAQPAEADYSYRTVEPLPSRRARTVAFNAALGLLLVLVFAPCEAAVVCLLLTHPPFLGSLTMQEVPVLGAALLFGLLGLNVLVVGLIPRLLSRLLKPGKVYPLFGFHFTVQKLIHRAGHAPVLTRLFGDSVAIVSYLRWVGWRFGKVVQTGSNFGIDVRQEIPSLTRVGSGTMVSDGLYAMNVEFSARSFRVVPVEVGENCFLGNSLAWPGTARTGSNLLLATKAMVPVGGPVRSDTGLLGSPCFEIPRYVEGDEQFAHVQEEPERSRRLRAKTRHNVATMGMYLLSRYLVETALLAIAVAPLRGWFGTVGAELLDAALLPILFFVTAEIAVGGRRLQPRTVSVLDRRFWRHERFWKLQSDRYLHIFDGTPLKGTIWRLLGVKVGPRLFDDGCGIVERSLTTIGADVTLNVASELQAHSLENGVFRSDRIHIGDRCTVGVEALVHYGVTMENDTTVEADSFVMKGTRLEAGSRWRGNPAMVI